MKTFLAVLSGLIFYVLLEKTYYIARMEALDWEDPEAKPDGPVTRAVELLVMPAVLIIGWALIRIKSGRMYKHRHEEDRF